MTEGKLRTEQTGLLSKNFVKKFRLYTAVQQGVHCLNI